MYLLCTSSIISELKCMNSLSHHFPVVVGSINRENATIVKRVRVKSRRWMEDSWKLKKALQLPEYPNPSEAELVLRTVEGLPPLIFAEEALRLEDQLAEVALGRSFLLQGGDCAESFKDFNVDYIRDTFRVLVHMSLIIMFGGQIPVVKVGRIAGQFAKPRSTEFEEKNGVKMLKYKGDAVNGHVFDARVRTPDPQRMLRAYWQSAATLNLLRAFATHWNLNFVEHSDQAKRYDKLTNRVDKILGSMAAVGFATTDHPTVTATDFWTSHECLLLPYEQALTRCDLTTGRYYNCSAHMLWLGERTRQPEGAHVEFLRGVANPLGIKVSENVDPDELVQLITTLNPNNKPGRINIITRMGAKNLRMKLPHLIQRVRRAGQIVGWISDPMHGNTIIAPCGRRTRPFDAVVEEVEAFFDVHEEEGSHPGGVHLEMIGQEVTECIGGSQNIGFGEMGSRYETLCDPRLNASQSLELASIIAERLSKRRVNNKEMFGYDALVHD